MSVKDDVGKAEQDKRSQPQQRFAMQMNGLKRPGDLREMVRNETHLRRKVEEIMTHYEEEKEDIELSLGLSTNGRFGVDPKRAKTLTRSSSISTFMMINNNGGDGEGSCGAAARLAPLAAGGGGLAGVPLTRTCSLPTEAEEEWRRRKELQSLRRMEARRKRLEKLKNGKVGRDKVDFEDNCEDNGPGSISNVNEMSPASLHAGSCLSTGGGGGAAAGDNNCKGLVASQCSIASQGSGSSGVSDFESQPTQGTKRFREVKSPASIQSPPEQIEEKQAFPSSVIRDNGHSFTRIALQNPSMKVAVADRAKETGRNVILDMPCVSTRGDGPNGRRIEGFLHGYGKGEELKIVCVCHGSFLSPAEFVKHAGGGDVACPLKHIVVYPPSVL